MKNILLLMSCLLISFLASSQAKVFSSGDVAIKSTGIAPRAILDINSHTAGRTTSQFGSFGVQSFQNTNGFLIHNGYYDGQYRNLYPGHVNWLHFIGEFTFFRSSGGTALPSGGSFDGSTGEIGIVARANSKVGISMPRSNYAPSYDLHVHGEAGKTSGSGDWIVVSDKQLKKNVKPFNDGLEKLMQIKPVSFEYNGKAGTVDDGEEHIGLIAQEMKDIAPYTLKKYINEEYAIADNGVDIEKKSTSKEYLALDNGPLRFVIINAIKEQQEIIEKLSKQVEDLQAKVEKITEGKDIPQDGQESEGTVTLMQSFPNPAKSLANIYYNFGDDQNLNGSASLNIINMNGKLVKKINLVDREGLIQVNTSDFASGQYIYNIQIGNRLFQSKKLIVAK